MTDTGPIPSNPPTLTPDILGAELGFVGVKRAGGYSLEEFLNELRGMSGLAIYKEMGANDPIIGAMLWVLTLLARQVTWQMQPADDTPQAQEIAEFFEGAMRDFNGASWEDNLSAAMSMIQYGWSWLEVTTKQRLGMSPPAGKPSSKFNDRKYGWAAWEERSQDTWQEWIFDPVTDRLLGFRQLNPYTSKTAIVPLWKSLHFRTTATRGNPEGKSVLRSAYLPWYYKRRFGEYEAIGVERDLVGLPIGWVPAQNMSADASDTQKQVVNVMKQTIVKVRRNETDGLVLPLAYDEQGHKLYDFGLLQSGGQRQFDIGAIITRYDQRILLAGLCDFLLLGHEGVGGLGVTSIGATKVDLLNAAMGALVGQVAAEINDTAIPMLMRLNGFPLELAPEWQPGQVKGVDLAALGAFIANLATSGAPIWPNEELQQWLYRQADLPIPDTEQLEAAAAAAAAAREAARPMMAPPTGPPQPPPTAEGLPNADGSVEAQPSAV